MKFHINKQSEISAHEQLREQIIFLISTGELAIGEEMPSVRSLSRHLGISLNTVSKVYSELVRANWLIEHAGTHHRVVERKDATGPSPPVTDLDYLIDNTIGLAQAHGYSLQQLAARLRQRLLEQPPDHLLIVAPDQGIGEIMREEIGSRIGYAPPVCGLDLLQQNPALGIGAVLITPAYVVERLRQFTTVRQRILPVSYTPLDELMLTISNLSQPSMIGWVSVSGAGLKTITGMVAPVIGDLHSSNLFLLESLDPAYPDQFRLRRYESGEYHPKDILKPAGEGTGAASSTPEAKSACDGAEVGSADLRCMDLLFCDSVTGSLVHHQRCVTYKLLSDDSLDRIEAEAAALPRG